eukprot:TRINITY_DN7470_c0_g1_i1.p2 TRINITY_DN7470_c0_g1~~TRINITY_DN7470_c0_g1_i1.p2  ORF type:complete len:107 (+),score=14.03 TRINITY_DN7470_c0_g1_i1:915-1235(+)
MACPDNTGVCQEKCEISLASTCCQCAETSCCEHLLSLLRMRRHCQRLLMPLEEAAGSVDEHSHEKVVESKHCMQENTRLNRLETAKVWVQWVYKHRTCKLMDLAEQ